MFLFIYFSGNYYYLFYLNIRGGGGISCDVLCRMISGWTLHHVGTRATAKVFTAKVNDGNTHFSSIWRPTPALTSEQSRLQNKVVLLWCSSSTIGFCFVFPYRAKTKINEKKSEFIIYHDVFSKNKRKKNIK